MDTNLFGVTLKNDLGDESRRGSRLPLRERRQTTRASSMSESVVMAGAWRERCGDRGGGRRGPLREGAWSSVETARVCRTLPRHRNNSSCSEAVMKSVSRHDGHFYSETSVNNIINRYLNENLANKINNCNFSNQNNPKSRYLNENSESKINNYNFFDQINQKNRCLNETSENKFNNYNFSDKINSKNIEIFFAKLKENNLKNIPIINFKNESNVDFYKFRKSKYKQEKSIETKNRMEEKNQSIFKFFKLKVNSLRQKIMENEEVKDLEDKKSMSKTGDIFEERKPRDFLLKLYNECKKLNGNIIKLCSVRRRSGGSKNNKRKSTARLRRTQSAAQFDLETFVKNNNKLLKGDIISESEVTTRNVNEGNYYDLACFISPDIANSSINNTKLREENLKSENINNKALSDEMTVISSEKSMNLLLKSLLSSENNEKDNKESKKESNIIIDKNINEFDDTLCDLNEDMDTESCEMSLDDELNINMNEIKSPVSYSDYVTANDHNNGIRTVKTRMSEEMRNKDSAKTSSAIELLPRTNPSFKNCDSSLRIDRPRSTERLKMSSNEEIYNEEENKTTINNRFITVFEKQFPQRYYFLNPTLKEEKDENNKDYSSKFSSSLTVNCVKKSFDYKENFKYFNPFKPPIFEKIKNNVLYNINNNNVIENDCDKIMFIC